MPELRRKTDLIAIDLPGFGLSTINDGPTVASFNELIESTHDFIYRQKLGPVTLVGHSLGGWVASKLAVNHPSAVSRLILINPAGVFTDGIENLAAMFDVHETKDVSTLLNTMWYRFPWYYAPFVGSILRDLSRRRIGDFARSIKREDFLSAELGSLRIPIALLWGMEDRLLSADTISMLQQWIPNLFVSRIEKCGHIPQLEAPERCARAISERLDGKPHGMA